MAGLVFCLQSERSDGAQIEVSLETFELSATVSMCHVGLRYKKDLRHMLPPMCAVRKDISSI